MPPGGGLQYGILLYRKAGEITREKGKGGEVYIDSLLRGG